MNQSFRQHPWLFVVSLLAVLGAVPRTLPGQSPAAPAVESSEVEVVVEEPTAPAGALKTVAAIGVTDYNELFSDIGFVGSLGDRPELGQMVEGMLALFTQGKGLASLDKTQPWGVILQTNGTDFLPVACLPVKDFDELIGLVEGFGVPVTDGEENVKVINTPDGRTLYVKHEGDWAFVGQSMAELENLPPDPQATLSALVEQYDVGAQISVQNVPANYRQMGLQALRAGMEDGLKRQEGEDEQAYQARRELAEKQVAQLEQMINDIDELSLGWAIDADQQRMYFDVVYRFVAGSKLAKQIASYGQPETDFAGFYQPDAAATFSLASKTDPALVQEDLEQMQAMFNSFRQQAEAAIDEDDDLPDEATRAAFKAAVNDFIDAAQATIESADLDSAGSVNLRPGAMTALAGALVKEPGKVESGLKKLAAVAENQPDFAGVQWDADSHAGVSFHTLSVPVPADEEDARKMFGDEIDISVGIGEEAVYVGVGQENLAGLKQAIDASSREAGKAVPPFELSLALGQIMNFAAEHADEDDRQMVQSIADMLNNQAQGRDHIRLFGKLLDNGLRYRFEAEEGVLRAFGQAAAEAQRKQQQQQQFGP